MTSIRYSRVHIFVEGKVQGVYFRQNTLYKAQELNIFGWVRNIKDGRVEAVFEGQMVNIQKILNWCKLGPKNAMVSNIEIITESYNCEFSDFQILDTI